MHKLTKPPHQPDPNPLPPFKPVKQPQVTPGQFAANVKWLQTNWKNYNGLWVALNNGELLCAGGEEQDLHLMIQGHQNEINILCLLVGRDYSEQ